MSRPANTHRPPAPLEATPAGDFLPSAPEAEKVLLGVVFTEATAGLSHAPSLGAATAEGIGPRHFENPTRRAIFMAMRALHQRGAPPDLAGVWAHIESEVGGVDEATRSECLALSRDAVSTLHLPEAIAALRKAEAARQSLRATHSLRQAILDGDSDQEREARRLLTHAGQEDCAGLPRIVCAADLAAREVPTPPVLITGLLHRGAKLLIGGGSKSYKSWGLIDLAVSVATGAPFWGISTTSARVLYLNFEIPEPFFRGRMLAVAKAKGVHAVDGLRGLDVWTLRGHAADLSRLVPHIIAQAAGRDYGLIILDPIYKCLGDRDENSAGEIGELLNEVEALAHRTGAAVAIAHHFAKGSAAGKDSKDRVSGSGVWARDPDALVTITPHEIEGAFTIESTLRNFSPRAPFCVLWDWPLLRPADDLDPSQLKQAPGRPKEWTSEAILALLPPGGASYSTWSDIALGRGASESTFKRRVKELRDLRAVSLVGSLYMATGRGGIA
jgi:hypothetical protein